MFSLTNLTGSKSTLTLIISDHMYVMEKNMLNRIHTSLPIILFLTVLTASFGNTASAGSLKNKLQQCKQSFATSHNKDATQKTAAAAKLKHLKLMKEILNDLNKKNTGKQMTASDIQENVMVMSHLLEMLVTENLNNKEETWNMNY